MDGKLYDVFCMLTVAHGGSTGWDCSTVKPLPGRAQATPSLQLRLTRRCFFKGVVGVVVVAGTIPDRSRFCARMTLKMYPAFWLKCGQPAGCSCFP